MAGGPAAAGIIRISATWTQPEPASLILAAIGLIVVVLAPRRRRRILRAWTTAPIIVWTLVWA
jgi:MYXO-CTERM domain-containing protein